MSADALWGGSIESRLAALGELCAREGRRPRRGVNLHIHTNESFSVFRSPTEAVAQAAGEGVVAFGINDHYTVAGHEEFRRACEVARLPATFSLEAVAMDREAERSGARLNDPSNPGRVYLCGKGVTNYPSEDSDAARSLARMRGAVAARSRAMNEKMRALFRKRVGAEGPSWEDVLALTPRGNATERHVARAAFGRARQVGPDAVATLCGAAAPAGDNAVAQNFIRAKLLKAGTPCFVAEDADAFLPTEAMRDLFLAFGAIPTYPVLADPVTEGERDLEALVGRLASIRIHALEVIPGRNTRERLAAVVSAARARHIPLFSGTEHNTPEAKPLLDAFMLDPEFESWFERSACVLLGHQAEAGAGQPGFVNARGTPTMHDARARFKHFERAGREARERIESVAD